MEVMWDSAPVFVEDRVAAPCQVPAGRLRDLYFDSMGSLTFGVIRAERWRTRLGPLTLLAFGEPVPDQDGMGWTWPILGGLLARRPGGTMSYRWREGELTAVVDGYLPELPAPVYRALQLRVHRTLTRRLLLRMRSRRPPPGVPAGLDRRMLAATFDLALCAAATAVVGRRRRLTAMLGVTAAYHLASWALGGRTVGGALAGTRVVAVDGSPVSLLQALTRLVAVPLAALRLRPLHDLLADTEVIES